MYRYTYLVSTLLLMSLWFIFYLSRKDLRTNMLVTGSVVLVFGIGLNYFFWIVDWWKPTTITGTVPSIEDFLGLFGIGGSTAVLYEMIFRKKLVASKIRSQTIMQTAFLSAIFILSHGTSSFIFNFHSWVSWIIAALAATFFIYVLRPDLIFKSITTGIILAFLYSPSMLKLSDENFNNCHILTSFKF